MDKGIYEQYQAQSALQSEGIGAQSSHHLPQLQQEVQQIQAVLIDSLDPRKIVTRILLEFQGLEETEEGEYRRIGEPIMNDIGIGDLRYILRSLINQHITMTWLDEARIRSIMEEFQRDLVYKIGLNWKRWNMKKADKDLVNDVILMNVYATLMRALEKNEKNFIGRIVMEMLMPGKGMQPPKKEGLFSKLKL